MLFLLFACASREPVQHQVEAADLAVLGPERLAQLDEAENSLAEAQAELTMTAERLGYAVQEAEAAQASVDGAVANRDAARAELKAADVTRDAARRQQAAQSVRDYEDAIREGQALRDWKLAERDAAEARTDVARAAVNLRHAELEMARVDLVDEQGRATDYAKSEFLDQLADTRKRWERAMERADEAEQEAEQARRAWEDTRQEPRPGS